MNGLSDAEIRREVLGWKLLDESSLAETVAFIEQKEMARDAFKGEAAAVKTGYRKQHVTGGPSDEAKLRKRVKCDGCDSQINQFARARSGKLCEHKFCKPCWKNKNNIQRKDVKMSKVEATVPEREENVKVDEASTLFVSSNFAGPGPEDGNEGRLASYTIAGKNARRIKVHGKRDNVQMVYVAGIRY